MSCTGNEKRCRNCNFRAQIVRVSEWRLWLEEQAVRMPAVMIG